MRQAMAISSRIGAHTIHASSATIGNVANIQYSDVVIAAGRQSIAPARRLARRRDGPLPFVVVLQPVLWRPGDFDLLWAPTHDRAQRIVRGRVPLVETVTAPSTVTAHDMQAAAEALSPALAELTGPYVGVLVGGPSSAYRFGPAETAEFANRLAAFANAHDVSVLVSTSGRTPPGAAAVFRRTLPAGRHFVFDAAEPGGLEPSDAYAAILGLSDHFVVTSDSFAMMSEAAATGKPIYGWRLPGGKAKFDRFHDSLVAHGALRWFDGDLERWRYPPIDSAGTIAAAVRTGLDLADRTTQRI
ncbi:MAG: hypothetical protein AcusKO_38020 [Acuticoccus sp.]